MELAHHHRRPKRGRRYALTAAGLLAAVALGGWGLKVWMTQPPALPVASSSTGTPRALDSLFDAAVESMQAGRYEDALGLWHEAMRLNPGMPEVAVNMGFTLYELGEFGAARDLFVGAIELNSFQANAYYGLAIASEQLGDLPGAMGAMRSYVHLADGEQDRSYLRRARAALWEWEARIAEQRGTANAVEALAPAVEPEH